MNNFTTETYSMKREILTYANKISSGTGKPNVKFVANMIYGMSASGSVLLSDISDALKERVEKINTVDRLSRHLRLGLPKATYRNYIKAIKDDSRMIPLSCLTTQTLLNPPGRSLKAWDE
jgi:hypothetical protein